MLELVPLSHEEALELVRQAAGGRIEDPEAAAIAERAGGNPFFIIEITGMLMRDDGPRAAVPPTVQAVVASRIDALSAAARTLARRSSVFFVSFDLR